jgi:hypothetical protein
VAESSALIGALTELKINSASTLAEQRKTNDLLASILAELKRANDLASSRPVVSKVEETDDDDDSDDDAEDGDDEEEQDPATAAAVAGVANGVLGMFQGIFTGGAEPPRSPKE